MSKAAAFKAPTSLAACADALYTTREARLTLQKQVDALAKAEALLRDHLINTLPKSSATGIQGKLVRVSIVNKDVVTVADWDALHAYIIKSSKKNPGVWALMNKAVGVAGVKEMWERGVEVPGVVKLEVPTVSMNKVGA